MVNGTISVFKFVGTISLGLLTGVSASLSTIALPALLTLPTAVHARSTLTYLSSKSRLLSSYLRHITTFTLFSAYLLSPRRFRHPYLLYTSILTFASGYGVDYTVKLKTGVNERRGEVELEAQGDDVNGEQVRQAVERMRFGEGVRAVVAGLGFAMGVVGLWGDGA
ncbi:hypothetical protein CC80DRAFT_401264 [Byssothecium circinans]|uniref:DUF1772-domain-containing protein n=1 Tax=Byssothecium circinans TaxID=147558 RepID=A0A6A5UKP3_9PLEO|nr:hypothetical protein CC80DRAFT_401264 [Byssothecium circinans]